MEATGELGSALSRRVGTLRHGYDPRRRTFVAQFDRVDVWVGEAIRSGRLRCACRSFRSFSPLRRSLAKSRRHRRNRQSAIRGVPRTLGAVQSLAVTPAGNNAIPGPASAGSAPAAHITAWRRPMRQCPRGAGGPRNNSDRQRDGTRSFRPPDRADGPRRHVQERRAVARGGALELPPSGSAEGRPSPRERDSALVQGRVMIPGTPACIAADTANVRRGG